MENKYLGGAHEPAQEPTQLPTSKSTVTNELNGSQTMDKLHKATEALGTQTTEEVKNHLGTTPIEETKEQCPPQSTDESQAPPPEGKGKRSLWKRIIGIISLIVLVLGGFSLYVKHLYDKSAFADTVFTHYTALALLRYDRIEKYNHHLYFAYQGQYKGLLNQQAKVLIPAEYKQISLRPVGKNFTYTLDGDEQKQGYISRFGRYYTEAKYDTILPEIDNLIIVSKNGLYGMLNYYGEEVIPLRYKSLAYPEMSDLKNAWYSEEERRWYIGCTCHREEVKYVSDDLILAQFEGGKYGFMNDKGEVVIPGLYDEALPFDNDRAAVKLHGKWGYIMTYGSWCVQPKYQEAWSFDGDFAVVRGEKGLGFVNEYGEEIGAMNYDDIKPFGHSRFAPVCVRGKWGVIDSYGSVVVQPKYDDITPYLECGLAGVSLGEKWGVINEQGVVIIPIKYDTEPVFEMQNHNVPTVSLWEENYNNIFEISGDRWDTFRHRHEGC